jgi:hypothetical protein
MLIYIAGDVIVFSHRGSFKSHVNGENKEVLRLLQIGIVRVII